LQPGSFTEIVGDAPYERAFHLKKRAPIFSGPADWVLSY
jgi:hypothetical protein